MKKKILFCFILPLLFFQSSHSQDIDYEFANYLHERLNRSGKVTSVDFIVSEERGRFNAPKSFKVIFYFPNNSLSMYYLKNEEGRIRKVSLIDGNEKEDITYLVEGIRLNRWFRLMRREFRKIPSGKYENHLIK